MNTYNFRIADIGLMVEANESHIATELLDFCTDQMERPGLSVRIVPTSGIPELKDSPILHNDYMLMYFEDERYTIKYPGEPGIDFAEFTPGENSPDTGSAYIYYDPSATDSEIAHGAFMALRLMLSYCYQKQGKFMMHAASFIYKEKVWPVSAKSGTGKSTLVRHMKEAFPNEAADYNGDLALISKNVDPDSGRSGAKIHGIPWNGTSGIFSSADMTLGGIIILHRTDRPLPAHAVTMGTDGTNMVYTLPDDEQALSVLQRLISPSWHDWQLIDNKCFAEDIISAIPVWQLAAADDISAAVLVKKAIDTL